MEKEHGKSKKEEETRDMNKRMRQRQSTKKKG